MVEFRRWFIFVFKLVFFFKLLDLRPTLLVSTLLGGTPEVDRIEGFRSKLMSSPRNDGRLGSVAGSATAKFESVWNKFSGATDFLRPRLFSRACLTTDLRWALGLRLSATARSVKHLNRQLMLRAFLWRICGGVLFL